MKTRARSAVFEREVPDLTFGDLVAAMSEVAEKDAPALLTELFVSGRARFVDPSALDRLETFSRPPHSARRAARASRGQLYSMTARQESCVDGVACGQRPS
jgi:hypothetical protein